MNILSRISKKNKKVNKIKDFYVYAMYIKDTKEIFYIGKERGNDYKIFHDGAYEAKKICEKYDTDIYFINKGLTEEQAIELENNEMIRILNGTNDRLTNRVIPIITKRDNGYNRSPNTPKLEFEKTPCLYASEIEEHYYGIQYRKFDEVKDENLKAVVFITRSIRDEVEIIYDGYLDNYRNETVNLLLVNESKILKTKYAKSVTAWIYIGDDYVTFYERDQKKVLELLGRKIPTYHLLDVRNHLIKKHGEVKVSSKEKTIINPNYNRISLEEVKNKNNWNKGFDNGYPLWLEGDKERKENNIKKALELFDEARYNAPALYMSYAMGYRKIKDYDNEIAVIDEAVESFGSKHNTTILKLKMRRERVVELKKKQNKLNN